MLLILAGCLNALPSASEGPCNGIELCNDLDDDCDGTVDESPEDAPSWGRDDDGDGYGSSTDAVVACSAPPTYVPSTSDCDDSDPEVHPEALELCNDLDDDCDGDIDEDATDMAIWYADGDGDDWGLADDTTYGCEQPMGYGPFAGDCDDANSGIHPDAVETCDGLDQDCDEVVDEDAADALTLYEDADGDGYGSPDSTARSCELLPAWVENDEDCDDSLAAVNPGAEEACNATDDDCSGTVDDDDACPCDTHWDDDGRPYLFCVDFWWDWSDAQSGCKSANYHLLTIDSEEENKWVVGLLRGKGSGEWWTGFNDRDTEDFWEWEDGSPVTYTNWADDQPNNYWGQDCMELFADEDETWNDADCWGNQHFICESY